MNSSSAQAAMKAAFAAAMNSEDDPDESIDVGDFFNERNESVNVGASPLDYSTPPPNPDHFNNNEPQQNVDQNQFFNLESEEQGQRVSVESVLQQIILDQQQQQHQLELQKQLEAAATAEAARISRPQEHFITIAQEGTILGATETITGFLPDSLLMKSMYDNVYHDDLMGFQMIKDLFWDKDNPNVEVFNRRKTLERNWIWVVTKVVSVIDNPLKGFILHEQLFQDESIAVMASRLTKILSLLIHVLQEADVWKNKKDNFQKVATETTDNTNLMDQATSGKVDESSSLQMIQVKSNPLFVKNDKEIRAAHHVCSGAIAEIRMIDFSPSELKLVGLVLKGQLTKRHLKSLIQDAFRYNYNLSNVLKELSSEYSRTPHLMIPPPLAVINLSFSKLGNEGMEMLNEVLCCIPLLETLDISFCSIEEKGMIAMCRSMRKRKLKGIPSLLSLNLTGNVVSYKVSKELGITLSIRPEKRQRKKRGVEKRYLKDKKDGFEEDGFEEDELDDDEININYKKRRNEVNVEQSNNKISPFVDNNGIQRLSLGCASLLPTSLHQLLRGLGHESQIQEINIPSNNLGSEGMSILVMLLEGKGFEKIKKLDLSNNSLGDDGIRQLTRALSIKKDKKVKKGRLRMLDLHLSFNEIGSGGIETMMNMLLLHNLVSVVTLSLDNNLIGDKGCQLIAASLPSLHHLSSLNLNFNQIKSRGMTSLMRGLIGCESITYLGLSGNMMQINGAIAMGFALSQHPRLAILDLDNCCLSQVAQCHIVGGIISNRWVPMQKLNGFQAGPPMATIGALDLLSQHLSNEECFNKRRSIQMKTILQWKKSNQVANLARAKQDNSANIKDDMPKQDSSLSTIDRKDNYSDNAYKRMLEWLSRIPFDVEELNDLRKYFYDVDDGDDGLRGSDGNINLKHRGDLLASLCKEEQEEIRDNHLDDIFSECGAVGLDLESNINLQGNLTCWSDSKNQLSESIKCNSIENLSRNKYGDVELHKDDARATVELDNVLSGSFKQSNLKVNDSGKIQSLLSVQTSTQIKKDDDKSQEMKRESSDISCQSEHKHSNPLKIRVTMFPQVQERLNMLKTKTQEIMNIEIDPSKQDIIAQNYAEESLRYLRQLKYHCMNIGFDGWRHGKIRRKILIVDDSCSTRKRVARAFEKAHFIVDTAENGREGVEKMKNSIYDIAFMDIEMPVMNGFVATKALREWEDTNRPGTRQPICALTAAYVDDFERSELMKFKEAGLDVMESKPCNFPRLFKVVDDVSPMFSDLSISLTQLPEINS